MTYNVFSGTLNPTQSIIPTTTMIIMHAVMVRIRDEFHKKGKQNAFVAIIAAT